MRLFKNIRLGGKLLASYVQNNRKAFVFGILVSLMLAWGLPKVAPILFKPRPKSIGLVGNYTLSTLPRFLQEEISYGLVKLESDGSATTGAAVDWTATDSGKTFVFHLDQNLFWQDGQKLESSSVNYNLKGVEVSRPDSSTVQFSLKEPFAPLVNLLSQPMFKTGLVGLGENRIINVQFAGRFLSGITLENMKTKTLTLYRFFPSEKDLVTGLRLGSVRNAIGLHSVSDFEEDGTYQISWEIKPDTLAVVFFNVGKAPFDDKSFRQGLVYALPDEFSLGQAAQSPFAKNHWAQTGQAKKYPQNLELARKSVNKIASTSATPKIILTTNQQLQDAAYEILEAWGLAGVDARLQISDSQPVNFDAYLTLVDLPSDPDQYALWHSTQNGNISGYKSFKVDKLLEEGRRAISPKDRLDAYGAFEKAVTEDAPAAFLYYPKVHTLRRKN